VTRHRRTRILVQGEPGLRGRLCAEVLAAADVREVDPPGECLVMLTMREPSQGTRFHPGELLVTRARARIGAALGLGMIAGRNPRAAWELAVIDAAYACALPLTQGWEEPLAREESRLAAAQARSDSELLQTRVDFASMD
jgi:phosphonate C-P lyase system protein PhnG